MREASVHQCRAAAQANGCNAADVMRGTGTASTVRRSESAYGGRGQITDVQQPHNGQRALELIIADA